MGICACMCPIYCQKNILFSLNLNYSPIFTIPPKLSTIISMKMSIVCLGCPLISDLFDIMTDSLSYRLRIFEVKFLNLSNQVIFKKITKKGKNLKSFRDTRHSSLLNLCHWICINNL